MLVDGKFVDEQQVIGGPRGETLIERVSRLGGDQIVDQIGGERETDAVAAQAGELAESVGEVCLSDTARADEDHIAALTDEIERGGARDEIAIDALWVVEVIGVERRERKELRTLERASGAVLELDAKLVPKQVVDQGRRRIVACDGLLQRGIELASGMLEPERAHHVVE